MNLPHGAVLKRLVERAATIPDVVAVGAYGSTASGAWTVHSDLDLIVILAHEAPVNSLHFFIDGVPVDLNLKRQEDWITGEHGWLPQEAITPLWDPEGLLTDVRPYAAPSSDVQQYRYAHRHRLFKLSKWIGLDDEIADLMAAGATHWIAVSWFHARNLRFPGIELAVEHWRENDPEMIDLLIGSTRWRQDRLERITRASELALAPVGGLWSEGDVHMTGWDGPPKADEMAKARTLLLPLLNPGESM